MPTTASCSCARRKWGGATSRKRSVSKSSDARSVRVPPSDGAQAPLLFYCGSARRTPLLRRDADVVHHFLVSLGILLDAGVESRGRHANSFGTAHNGVALLYVRQFENIRRHGIYAVDHGLRRASGRE